MSVPGADDINSEGCLGIIARRRASSLLIQDWVAAKTGAQIEDIEGFDTDATYEVDGLLYCAATCGREVSL